MPHRPGTAHNGWHGLPSLPNGCLILGPPFRRAIGGAMRGGEGRPDREARCATAGGAAVARGTVHCTAGNLQQIFGPRREAGEPHGARESNMDVQDLNLATLSWYICC
jgi:hypothetical protein